MERINNIKIAALHRGNKGLVATAVEGAYYFVPGYAKSIVVHNPVNEPGKSLEENRIYAVAATKIIDGHPIPVTNDYRLVAIDNTVDHGIAGKVYVFIQ